MSTKRSSGGFSLVKHNKLYSKNGTSLIWNSLLICSFSLTSFEYVSESDPPTLYQSQVPGRFLVGFPFYQYALNSTHNIMEGEQ